MASVTITGPVLDSVGRPATGLFVVEGTTQYATEDGEYVSRTQYVVQVAEGVPLLSDGTSPWTQIVPPVGQAVRVFERLQPSGDTAASGTKMVQRTRVLQIPGDVSTVKYGDLMDVTPVDSPEYWVAQGPAGPEGPIGPAGADGLPGVNAVENDTAVAAYVGTRTSLTRGKLDQTYAPTNFVRHLSEWVLDGEMLDPTDTADMSPIFQRAVDALQDEFAALTTKRPFILNIPAGDYRIATGLVLDETIGMQIGFKGAGLDETFLFVEGDEACINGTTSATLDPDHVLFGAISIADFTIDGARQTQTSYDSRRKGIFIQSVGHFRAERVRIRNTLATGFGVDYIQDGQFIDCIAENCGRGHYADPDNPDPNDPANDEHIGSGAGYGLGTGLYEVENVTFTNCVAIGNYNAGWFSEAVLTRAGVTHAQTKGQVVTGLKAYGNWYGLLDAGSDGLVVTGCDLSRNLKAGFALDATHASPGGGINGRVSGGQITENGPADNSGAGILIATAIAGGYSWDNITVARNNGPGVRFTNTDPAGWALGAIFGFTSLKILENAGAAIRGAVALPADLMVDNCTTRGNAYGLQFVGAYTLNGLLARVNFFSETHQVTQTLSNPRLSGNTGLGLNTPSSIIATYNPTVAGTVALTWTAPLEVPDDYRVEWQDVNVGTWHTVTRSASTTPSQTITGLPSFAKLQFRVAGIVSSVVGTYAVSAAQRFIPTPYAGDHFNRSDRTLAGTATPTTDGLNALTYTDHDSGTWSILSNSIRPNMNYANSARKALTVDAGSATGTVRAVYAKAPPLVADISTSGVLVRYVDASNYVVLDMSSTNGWRLRKCVAGSYSVISMSGVGTGAIAPCTVGDQVMVQFAGSSYTVTINDQPPVTGTDTDLNAATRRGFLQAGANVSGGGSPMKWDDLETWNIAA